MIWLETHPALSDLHRLIDEAPYPINASDLRTFARKNNYKPEVIDFYNLFPSDQTFKNKNDLRERTELVEMMETENPPAEDFVHGAED